MPGPARPFRSVKSADAAINTVRPSRRRMSYSIVLLPSTTDNAMQQLQFVTSAKGVHVLTRVCLSACLFVNWITQRLLIKSS